VKQNKKNTKSKKKLTGSKKLVTFNDAQLRQVTGGINCYGPGIPGDHAV
jgi:hypothetical protein